jgi:DNA-binding Lrp family transcriptional regulator
MLMKNDMKIIEVLKENCRMPAKEISRRTGIPISTVCNRIGVLERDGVIKKYRAVVDNQKMGKDVEAFIRIDVSRDPDDVIEKLIHRPEVEECYVVSGSIEILLKVAMASVEDLNALLSGIKSKNILKMSTQIILKNVEKRKAPDFTGAGIGDRT